MRPLRGMRALHPDEVLLLRERAARLYAPGGRLDGHARQGLLAERTNPTSARPEWAEGARLRRAAAEAAERRTAQAAKKRAQRLRKAARGGDARAQVRQAPPLPLPRACG